jgi:hypothetical protein
MDLNKFGEIVRERIAGYSAINKQSSTEIFSYLKSVLAPMGLNISYDYKGSDYVTFIVHLNKKNVKRDVPFVNYSNGLIFRVYKNEYRLLAVPARDCVELGDLNVIRDYEDYNIYPLLDGMNAVLYYDPDEKKWVFGTHHSINIATQTWRGYKYSDLIDELMNGFKYEGLDKTACHHLRFKHSAIHPYKNNVNFVYHLGSFSLTDLLFKRNNIGIRTQEPIKSSKLEKHRGFGYVFRNKGNSHTDVHIDYKYESYLRKQIVKMVYQPPFIKDINKRRNFLNYFAMPKYFILNNYLNNIKRDQFLKYFPQYESDFLFYDSVVDKVVQLFRNDVLSESSPPPSLDNIAQTVYKSIVVLEKDRYDIKPNEPDTIIRDLLMNPKYSFTFYNAIYN